MSWVYAGLVPAGGALTGVEVPEGDVGDESPK